MIFDILDKYSKVYIYGYDRKSLDFLCDFYEKALKNGKYIKGNFENPVKSQAYDFLNYANNDLKYTKDEILGYFPYLDSKQILADELFLFLQNTDFSSETIKKNAYVKIMCWIKFSFLNVIRLKNPYILFEASPTKYEKFFLELLLKLGAKIVVLDMQNKPLEHLETTVVCERFGIPTVSFVSMYQAKINSEKAKERSENPAQNVVNAVNYNGECNNSDIKINEKLFKKCNQNIDKDDVFSIVSDKNTENTSVYAKVLGVDELGSYSENLHLWYLNIKTSQMPVIIVNSSIRNPEVFEVEKYKNVQSLSDFSVNFLPTIELNILAKNAILKVLLNEKKQKNLLICTLCWLERYKELFSARKSVFLLFNGHKYSDMIFLKVLKLMGINVLLINPDKNLNIEIDDGDFLVLEHQNTKKIEKFPIERQVLSTVASHAERELDTLLYNDNFFFRDRQFKATDVVTLKTTFDEIFIMWKAEAKFRPFFEATDNLVKLPNVFAKVSGVFESNQAKYIAKIKEMQNENTILKTNFNFTRFYSQSPFLHKNYIKNSKLDYDKIIKDSDFKYSHLSEETVFYILSKLEKLLLGDYILENPSTVEKTAYAVILDLDRDILRLIAGFDFTKEVPKFLLFHTVETQPTLADCILLSFLNLVGFDIVVFTPTGYRNIEKFIKSTDFNEYKVGEFVYEINSNAIEKSNIMNKLFGRSF